MKQAIKSANILVVDDELGIRESMRMILKDNYNAFTVSNAFDPLKHVEDSDTETDVILLDIRMPQLNGLDFLDMMQCTAYAIPIIIVTAFPSSQSAITAFRNGVFDYIIKPFAPSEILAVVERALSRRGKLPEKEMLVDNLKKVVRKNFFVTTEALLLAIDATERTAVMNRNIISNRIINFFKFDRSPKLIIYAKQAATLWLFLTLSLVQTNAFAQGTSGLYNSLFGAKALGQGNAFVARADDATAVHFDPGEFR